MAKALPEPGRRRNSLRFRAAPGSSRRRAPSEDNGRYFDGQRLDLRRRCGAPARVRRGRRSRPPCAPASASPPDPSTRRPPASRSQQAPAEREPDRERGIEPPGQQQHRPRPGKTECRGLAGRQADAVHGKPAVARQRLHAAVVASAAGAADGDNRIRALVPPSATRPRPCRRCLARSRRHDVRCRRRSAAPPMHDAAATQRQARERAGRERVTRKFPRRQAPRDRSRAAARRRGAAALPVAVAARRQDAVAGIDDGKRFGAAAAYFHRIERRHAVGAGRHRLPRLDARPARSASSAGA